VSRRNRFNQNPPSNKPKKPSLPKIIDRCGHDGRPPIFKFIRDPTTSPGVKDPALSPKNINYNTIERLHNRRLITDQQYYAAGKLANDYQLTQPAGKSSFTLESGSHTGVIADGLSPKAEAASRRVRSAQAACGEYWMYADAAVIHNYQMCQITTALQISGKKAAKMLKLGLNLLAAHYGYM
jgi:hypothetical protein